MESVLLPLKSIIDAVVYGVRVHGVEGSVGMAAMVKSREAGTDEVGGQGGKVGGRRRK